MRPARPIRPERIRQLPGKGSLGFSWIDRRLFREGYLGGLSSEAGLLYLFLITAADREGMSFYGARGIAERTGLPSYAIEGLRDELIGADLVAYQAPFYQVLSLLPRDRQAGESTSLPCLPSVAGRTGTAHTARGGPPLEISEILGKGGYS